MERSTLEILKGIKDTAQVNIFTVTNLYMKENGPTIKDTEMEDILGSMDSTIKETLRMTKDTASEC